MLRLIVSCLLGIAIGIFLPYSISLDKIFVILLLILNFSIRLSIENVDIQKIFAKNRGILLLPLFSLSGSCIAAILYTLIFGLSLKETLLVASAMGFYST